MAAKKLIRSSGTMEVANTCYVTHSSSSSPPTGTVVTSGSVISVSATAGKTGTTSTVLTATGSSATATGRNSTSNNVPSGRGDGGNVAFVAVVVTVLVATLL
ncbi:hypothetical protein BC938DRAFT_471680 [Jimgerdemannia flammicorona]|uniref:Uncharacterized protein n=1 Tax=Jimgerdemannia flammicorona TaxID=994334 RepID=A0A433Q7L1_9FUNG|nr:hypothetical protein BC938DRAFT_471680 [Jimgerdemannia flammicorona]